MFNSTVESKPSPITTVIAAGFVAFSTYVPTFTSDNTCINQAQVTHLHGNHWTTYQAEEYEKFDLVGISDIIHHVQTTLGLPKKAIAEIFQVTRQTLHSYTKSDEPDRIINLQTLKRARELDEVTSVIAPMFDQSPGALVKNFMYDGKSLFDLLTSDVLDANKIEFLAHQLAGKMQKRPTIKEPMIGDETLNDLTLHI